MMNADGVVTAAVLVIGDEILSGRTKEKNIGYIADYLTGMGIDLREARIVADVEEEIVAALNALRARYTYVFTTGGIGPTHDDITAASVAKAFGVPLYEDQRIIAAMLDYLPPGALNEARRRMAMVPQGGELIPNPVSRVPGFRIGNVMVMEGVPSIMQAMLDGVAPTLKGGAPFIVESIEAGLPEGAYAAGLGAIASTFADLSIGSYPSWAEGKFQTQIVVRGRSADRVRESVASIRQLLAGLGSVPSPS
jgi:molybdenum cofactor synthesis domain-containing protein